MEANNNNNNLQGNYRIPLARYRGHNVNISTTTRLDIIRRNQTNAQAGAIGGAFLLPSSTIVPHTPLVSRRRIRRNTNITNGPLVSRRRQQLTNDIYTSGLLFVSISL